MDENKSEDSSVNKTLPPSDEDDNATIPTNLHDENDDSHENEPCVFQVENEQVSSDNQPDNFFDKHSVASDGSQVYDDVSNNFDQLLDLLDDVSSECSELNLKYSNTVGNESNNNDHFIPYEDDEDDDDEEYNLDSNKNQQSFLTDSMKASNLSLPTHSAQSIDNDSTSLVLNDDSTKSNSIKKKSSFFGNKISLRKKKSDANEEYYQTVRESKLKCRVTIFNAYNAIQKGKVARHGCKQVSITEDTQENDDTKSYILNFIKSELGYIKCVHYVTTFEKLIVSSMKKSTSAVFSKNNYSKLSLHYTELDNHLKDMETFLNEKVASD